MRPRTQRFKLTAVSFLYQGGYRTVFVHLPVRWNGTTRLTIQQYEELRQQLEIHPGQCAGMY